MARPDVSNYLIHFTKAPTTELAFAGLKKIIQEKTLLGGTGHIKGGFSCVCFSEAPMAALKNGLVNEAYYSRYSPFGVMVPKGWIYAQGGRPVIYQSDSEYDLLPEAMKWRHVRYEPNLEPPIDFAWEREWRIRCEALQFDEAVAKIVVRDSVWAQRLADEHDAHNEWLVQAYKQVFDEEAFVRALVHDLRWKIVPLI